MSFDEVMREMGDSGFAELYTFEGRITHITCHYHDNLLLPEFIAVVGFAEDKVTSLELREPTVPEILQHWWEKVRGL